MEEAKDYKKYLKALKEATKKSGKRKKNNKRPEIGIQGMLVARPFLKKLGGSMSKTDKKKFNPRTGEETNKPRGKDPRTIYKPENMKPKPITKKMGGLSMDYKKVDRIADRIKNPKKTPFEKAMSKIAGEIRDEMKTPMKKLSNKEKYERFMANKMKSGGLKGGQKKLDKNKNNRIDAQDFKILKAEKAKGRGMGLQDEKVKPGKVMKASKGGGADTGTRGEIRSKLSVAADRFKRRMNQMPGKLTDEERKKIRELLKDVKPARPARPMPNIKSDGPKRLMPSRPKPSLGPMARKMGGGMMNKPMGYKKGASIMARGCKLGRKKATKLY